MVEATRRWSLVIVDSKEEKNEIAFWRSRSAEDRIGAVEMLREQYYAVCGFASTPRLVKEMRLAYRGT